MLGQDLLGMKTFDDIDRFIDELTCAYDSYRGSIGNDALTLKLYAERPSGNTGSGFYAHAGVFFDYDYSDMDGKPSRGCEYRGCFNHENVRELSANLLKRNVFGMLQMNLELLRKKDDSKEDVSLGRLGDFVAVL